MTVREMAAQEYYTQGANLPPPSRPQNQNQQQQYASPSGPPPQQQQQQQGRPPSIASQASAPPPYQEYPNGPSYPPPQQQHQQQQQYYPPPNGHTNGHTNGAYPPPPEKPYYHGPGEQQYARPQNVDYGNPYTHSPSQHAHVQHLPHGQQGGQGQAQRYDKYAPQNQPTSYASAPIPVPQYNNNNYPQQAQQSLHPNAYTNNRPHASSLGSYSSQPSKHEHTHHKHHHTHHSHSHSTHRSSSSDVVRRDKSNSKTKNRFLGAGAGAILGDVLIAPGVGTAAGLLLGGWGGNEYSKRQEEKERQRRRRGRSRSR